MMRLLIWISRSSLRDEGIWDLVFGICRASPVLGVLF